MGKEAIHFRQAVTPQAGALLPPGEVSILAQAGTLLPLGEGSYLSQAGSQASTPLPLGEGSIVSQASSQVVTSKAGAQLTSGEASNLSQAGSQAGSQLPSGEGSSLVAGRQASQASQAVGRLVTPLSPKEGGSLVASPASQTGVHLPPARVNSSQAGQLGSQGTRSGRCSARQRPLQASLGNSTASQADSAGTWDSSPTPHPPNRLPQGSSPEDPNPKWVINLSNKPLTPAQRSVLVKEPNFAVSPKQPPNLEYITAIEAACTKLSQQDVEELRAEVNRVLRSSHTSKPNLTKAQNLAFKETKKGQGPHSPYCRQGGSYGNYG